jgi:hydrogenase nickel incorporation protein HypB
MCATCGCDSDHDHHDHHDHDHGDHHHHETVKLETRVLARNDAGAAQNRAWLGERSIVALNVMSSPGAGKTTLLERTLRDVRYETSVIEGDQETEQDAERIRAAGGRAVQIQTGAGCHLDAEMVGRALTRLEPRTRSLLFIENVGNLVCPALFDLGERVRVVVAAVTEGDDKPLKYPHMFRAADVILLNKIDLLPHVRFDRGRFARGCAGKRVIEISATRGDGLDEWYAWIDQVLGAA